MRYPIVPQLRYKTEELKPKVWRGFIIYPETGRDDMFRHYTTFYINPNQITDEGGSILMKFVDAEVTRSGILTVDKIETAEKLAVIVSAVINRNVRRDILGKVGDKLRDSFHKMTLIDVQTRIIWTEDFNQITPERVMERWESLKR